MKIVILYEKTEKEISKAAAHIIESHQCDVVYYQADRVLEDTAGSPTALLQNASHILFIFGKNTPVLAPAFIFFLGLGIGRNLPILTLGQGSTLPLPENCKQFIIPLALDIFEDYFVKEQKRIIKHFISLSIKTFLKTSKNQTNCDILICSFNHRRSSEEPNYTLPLKNRQLLNRKKFRKT